MPPLEKYLKQADKLAQDVVNVWGASMQAGNALELTTQFKDLLDKACVYQTARRFAENHRKHNVLTEEEAEQEQKARQAFAEAYKALHERHATAP